MEHTDDKKQVLSPSFEMATGDTPVNYVKSNFYRVVSADGVYGGGTPTPGNILMTFFNHRVPLPEKTVNNLFGNEIVEKRIVKAGIENEIEVSISMSLATAKIVRSWLDDTIRNTESLLQYIEQQKRIK